MPATNSSFGDEVIVPARNFTGAGLAVVQDTEYRVSGRLERTDRIKVDFRPPMARRR